MITTKHIPKEPQRPWPCGHEWRSESSLFGLPLIHVAWGRDEAGKLLVAKGLVAIGQYAFGIISISQFGTGAICISQFGIGLFALAQFSVALASISQFSLAGYTIAQMGVCFDGVGQQLLKFKELLN